MLKKVLVTQRVDHIRQYNERRDAYDQAWTDFLLQCGLFPLYLPNNEKYLEIFLKDFEGIAGIILTGGNDLVKYGGDAPERDKVEFKLIEYALEKKIPLMGICRGMQMIQDYYGTHLQKVTGHIGSYCDLKINTKSRYYGDLAGIKRVNSYHGYGACEIAPELLISATSPDGVVEAVEHISYPIFGQMWHPEREKPFAEEQMKIFRKLICSRAQFKEGDKYGRSIQT